MVPVRQRTPMVLARALTGGAGRVDERLVLGAGKGWFPPRTKDPGSAARRRTTRLRRPLSHPAKRPHLPPVTIPEEDRDAPNPDLR